MSYTSKLQAAVPLGKNTSVPVTEHGGILN